MNRVRGCTSTKSHASARCAPGPTAAPFTAAIVGLSSSHSSRMNVCTPARSASEVVRGVKPGLAGLRDGRRGEVHARAERVALAGDEHRAHARVGAELADRVDDAVAHPDRQRVLRLGPVEHDAADAVDVALDAEIGLGHRLVARLVRMLTTATPEPRPPALCWSA